jgi:hypothetical protein
MLSKWESTTPWESAFPPLLHFESVIIKWTDNTYIMVTKRYQIMNSMEHCNAEKCVRDTS